MENQPVLSFLGQLFKYLGYCLIIVLLFWRFLIPTSINHVSIGQNVFNQFRKKLVVDGVFFLLTTIWIVLFLEASFIFGDLFISTRTSISTIAVKLGYVTAIIFFLCSLFSFYYASKESRLVTLTQEIKAKLISPRYYISYVFWVLFLAVGLNVVSNKFRTRSENHYSSTIFTKPDIQSDSLQVSFATAEVLAFYETCNFYRVVIKDVEGIQRDGFLYKYSSELIDQNLTVVKADNYKIKCNN